MQKISSGITELDHLITGYPADGITTFFGPASSGKTNLLLISAIEIAKKGGKVLVINTEGEIIIERLHQLMENKDLIKSFIFLNIKNFNEQDKKINELCKFPLSNIDMILFDSSNKLLRAESTVENKKKFKQQLILLKNLARERKVPILITTQVYQSYQKDEAVIFGSALINEYSDCILEISILNKVRKLVLRKHNNICGEKIFLFEIKEKEIKSFIENCTKD